MPPGKLHVDELETSLDLVRRLLAAQHPQWSDLPIEQFDSTGTSNSLYRLGDDMVVRLPRRPGSAPAVGREHRWLPELAPYLPLPIPVPLALGAPGEGYPSVWSVYRWLDGETAAMEGIADPQQAATDLGRFLVALQRIDPTGGPRPDEGNYGRGCRLAARDDVTRTTIAALHGTIDTDAAMDAWQDALAAPAWSQPGVWIHGDLMPGNLLVRRGTG